MQDETFSFVLTQPIKLLIAGGREFNDYLSLVKYLNQLGADKKLAPPSHIISGMARGADALGVKLSKDNDIPLLEFPAEWDKHGKSAGYIRNTDMSKEADVLVACWDGKSRGTKHMIDTMRNLNKPVFILNY